jgi:hypothetical protein
MSKNPAETNRIWCRATQAAMEEKLGRALTQFESDKIWNTGSFQQLDQIDRVIYFAESSSELEKYLAGLSIREFLPEEYTRRDI